MLIAVYGSLKQGYHNHGVIEGSRLLGQDHLTGWDMYNLGAFPGIIAGEGTIHVEVYDVDQETALRVDALEGYRESNEKSSFYVRKTVQTQYGMASLYVFNKDLSGAKQVIGVAKW